jgi:hypothetical protein
MVPPLDESLAAFEKAADIHFRHDVAELYEAPIREAKELWRQYSNAGIATASNYSEKTADAVIDAFKSIGKIAEQVYIKALSSTSEGITLSREEWLRSKLETLIDLQARRAQGTIDKLCIGFGQSPHTTAVARIQGETQHLKLRLGELVTLAKLESRPRTAGKVGAVSPQIRTEGQKTTLLVFISHSSKDAKLAEALIDFLRAGLGLSEQQIKCSSVDGYRLHIGANTDSSLREDVNAAAVVIGLITPNSLRSHYVTFELGARWGTGSYLAPVIAGVTPSSVPAPLSQFNVLSAHNEAQLHQLLDDLSKHLSLTLHSAASYQRHLTNVKQIADSLPKPQVVNADSSSQTANTNSPKPNVVFVRTKTLHVEPRGAEGAFGFYELDHATGFKAVVACVRNEAKYGGVSVTAGDVIAHLMFRNSEGTEVADASRVAWLNDDSDMTDLDWNETKCVILYIVKTDGAVFSPFYRRKRGPDFRGEVISPDAIELRGEIPIAELRLIDADHNLVVPPLVFDLLYSNGEPQAKLKRAGAHPF